MREDPRKWIEEVAGPEAFAALLEYQKKLQQWNRKFALTSVDDGDIFNRLLAPSAWLGITYSSREIGRVADFGSGAGVPGLSMAIADSSNRYLLVEANDKKSAFLKACLSDRKINIYQNISVMNERLGPEAWVDKVCSVVSRGAGSLLEIAKLWDDKLGSEGRMDIFKGEKWDEEIEELNREYPQLKAARIEVPAWFGNLHVIEITREKRGMG